MNLRQERARQDTIAEAARKTEATQRIMRDLKQRVGADPYPEHIRPCGCHRHKSENPVDRLVPLSELERVDTGQRRRP